MRFVQANAQIAAGGRAAPGVEVGGPLRRRGSRECEFRKLLSPWGVSLLVSLSLRGTSTYVRTSKLKLMS